MINDTRSASSEVGSIGATGLSKDAAVIQQFTFSPEDCFLSPVTEQGRKASRAKPIHDVVTQAEKLGLVKANKKGTLWLQSGNVVKQLILAQSGSLMKQLGFSTLELPSFFSVNGHPGISGLIERFHRELVPFGERAQEYLRYASDPILFPMYSGKIRETTRIYSPGLFWRNESGNAVPLLRPREFLMTDFHSLVCRDDSWKEFCLLAGLNKTAIDLWIPRHRYSLKVEISLEFFEQRRNELKQLLTELEMHAIVRVFSQRTHYYSCQLQFAADVYGGNYTQIGNLQLDYVNGDRFGIKDLSGESVGIIHGTHIGRVEKILTAAVGLGLDENPQTATLPLAIAPVQVRLVALEGIQVDPYLIQKFADSGIRFDLRVVSKRALSQQIRQSAHDWIPYLCVIGDSEVRDGTLSVRSRAGQTTQNMTLTRFLTEFKESLKVAT